MPIFNRKDFLKKSITSILKQEFTDFELICIDDGSSDESVYLVEEYIVQDSRIRLIKLEKNEGRCIARNQGIENVRGEWICYLDSDDEYFSNHLSIHYQLILENLDYKAFATEQSLSGILKKYSKPKFRQGLVKLIFEDFIESNPISLNQLSHHKSLNIFFPNERIVVSEDWLFLRQLVWKENILKSNILTTNVTEHLDRSVLTTNWLKFAKYNAYASELFVRTNNVPVAISNQILSYTYLLCTNMLLSKAKMKKESLTYFNKAISYRRAYFHPLFYKALIKYLLP